MLCGKTAPFICLFCNLLVSLHWRWNEQPSCLCWWFCRPPFISLLSCLLFQVKRSWFTSSFVQELWLSFCLSHPFFSFTVYFLGWGSALCSFQRILSTQFVFFKLSGIIPWRRQLSLASMSCSLSQLELAIFSPMCIALCLFELKFIFHFNTVNPVSSFCDCLQSATLVTTLKNLVASANLVMSLFASYSRFLMNMLRSMCPSTVPAGILQVCNKLPLWKMTLYCYLIYLHIFYFFLVFKSVVHPCQSLYSSSAGSHSFVLVFVWIKLHT